MIKLSTLIFLFSSMLYLPIGGLFIFKRSKYESNYLLNINDDYFKIVLNKESYKKLNPKEYDYFTFFLNKEKESLKIISIKNNKNVYELILNKGNLKNSNDNEKIKIVSYFLEKNTLFDEIFS